MEVRQTVEPGCVLFEVLSAEDEERISLELLRQGTPAIYLLGTDDVSICGLTYTIVGYESPHVLVLRRAQVPAQSEGGE